jgi:hypothetical protein
MPFCGFTLHNAETLHELINDELINDMSCNSVLPAAQKRSNQTGSIPHQISIASHNVAPGYVCP